MSNSGLFGGNFAETLINDIGEHLESKMEIFDNPKLTNDEKKYESDILVYEIEDLAMKKHNVMLSEYCTSRLCNYQNHTMDQLELVQQISEYIIMLIGQTENDTISELESSQDRKSLEKLLKKSIFDSKRMMSVIGEC